MGANYVTWPELLAAAGVIGAMNMAIFGWLWKHSQAIDGRLTRAYEEIEDKQDKANCGTAHAALAEAVKSFEGISAKNGERLAKIETCLEFLVEALREHKKQHEKMAGGL